LLYLDLKEYSVVNLEPCIWDCTSRKDLMRDEQDIIHIENINRKDPKMTMLVLRLKNHNYAPFFFPSTVLKHPFK